MFYDFTNVHHVNENNALEFANQSMHYLSLKHEPYIKNVWKWFFLWQRTGQGKNFSFVCKYMYINSSQSCQNVSETIFTELYPQFHLNIGFQ